VGTSNELKGTAKEAAGSATGSDDLRAEGQARQRKAEEEEQARDAERDAEEHARRAERHEREERRHQGA
jgi:uncharacterized protein YjbJ (UPF0337 family)